MDVHPTENVSIGIDPSSNGKKTSGYRVKYYDLPRLRGEMLDHIESYWKNMLKLDGFGHRYWNCLVDFDACGGS